MRARLERITSVEIAYGGAASFGSKAEPLLFCGWLSAQLGHQVGEDGKVEAAHGAVEYRLLHDEQLKGMACATIAFRDGTSSTIVRDRERGVVIAQIGPAAAAFDHVTRMRGRELEALIVRQLKRPEADRIYLRALPVAMKLARQLVQA
jgi:glucose-6-phosphate dehydrogenase assembly protein OpcA